MDEFLKDVSFLVITAFQEIFISEISGYGPKKTDAEKCKIFGLFE